MAMPLLTALASMPPEQLVEGAQILVTKTDGSSYVLTLGKRVAPDSVPFSLTAAR